MAVGGDFETDSITLHGGSAGRCLAATSVQAQEAASRRSNPEKEWRCRLG